VSFSALLLRLPPGRWPSGDLPFGRRRYHRLAADATSSTGPIARRFITPRTRPITTSRTQRTGAA